MAASSIGAFFPSSSSPAFLPHPGFLDVRAGAGHLDMVCLSASPGVSLIQWAGYARSGLPKVRGSVCRLTGMLTVLSGTKHWTGHSVSCSPPGPGAGSLDQRKKSGSSIQDLRTRYTHYVICSPTNTEHRRNLPSKYWI